MVLETHVKLCVRAEFSIKNIFIPKISKVLEMGQNQVFLNLLKRWVINFNWICSIVKIYIICCVPVQILYLGTFLFLRYGPKCSQPIRLSKVDQEFLVGHDQKWAWLVCLWDSKIDFISRVNGWTELKFFMLVHIQKS